MRDTGTRQTAARFLRLLWVPLLCIAPLHGQETPEAWSRELGSPYPVVRARAAKALGATGDRRWAGILSQALFDPSTDVRTTVVAALRQTGGAESVPTLILATKDTSLQVRKQALDALFSLGDPARDALLEVLDSQDPEIRETTLRHFAAAGMPDGILPRLLNLVRNPSFVEAPLVTDALGRIGAPAVEPLIPLAESGNRAALLALAKTRDSRGVPSVLRVLGQACAAGNYSLVRVAAEAIRYFPDVRAVPYLIRGLGSGLSVDSCVATLVVIGEPALKPAVEAAVGHTDMNVRPGAISVLGGLKDPCTIDIVIAAARHRDVRMRVRAAAALGQFKDSRVIAPLGAAMRDADYMVRHNAVRSLVGSGDRAAIPFFLEMLRSRTDEMRASGVAGLRKVADVSLAPELLPLLCDRSSVVAASAAAGLQELGWKPGSRRQEADLLIALGRWGEVAKMGGDAVPALIPAVERLQGNIRVAALAIGALGAAGDERAVPFLVEQLSHRSDTIREAAVRSLGHFRNRAAADALRRGLRDPSSDVVVAAAKILRQAGDASALPSLAAALKSNSEYVASAIIETMIRLGGGTGVLLLSSGDYGHNKVADHTLSDAVKAVGAPALPALERGFDAHDEEFRSLIARAVGAVGGEDAVAVLMRCVHRFDEHAWDGAFQKIGSSAIPHLVVAMESHDPLLRKRAYMRLHRWQWSPVTMRERVAYWTAVGDGSRCKDLGTGAVEALLSIWRKRAGDEDAFSRNAGTVLGKITGRNLGPDIAAWEEWWNAHTEGADRAEGVP